ncbi:MAG: exodeoxyribonuclease V subunit alpha [Verrucomicrobia bacterium]|nr:exodeoxyribonuclease V subunit alpha [Verrucomicrobiota bacterium]
MHPVVPEILESETFSDIDREFSRFIARLAADATPAVLLAAALLSRARAEGHFCLDFRKVAGFVLIVQPNDPNGDRLPALSSWTAELLQCPVVGKPGQFTPLVLDFAGRLYLHRYWEYETNLAAAIRSRAGVQLDLQRSAQVENLLNRLFPPGPHSNPAQRLAAAVAAERGLCVITGGPGTGKTRTAAYLLALLLELAGEAPLRIALCAPTGKAAARLQESIDKLKPTLPCTKAILDGLPTESFTLHRLLGLHPITSQPRFHRKNPLPHDVVIVDEASMVDLALMAKLFDSLRSTARIVLLGDKDQLASVEAGAVLGDICHGAHVRSELSGCIVQLDKSHRFADRSGILELSQAVNDGDGNTTRQLLQNYDFGRPGLRGRELPAPKALPEALINECLPRFAELVRETNPLRGLQLLGKFRILCAVRRGPYGVETVNRCLEQALAEANGRPARGLHFAGRPILIKRNDPNLKLFNGDLGILLPDESTGALRAWFTESDGSVRSVIPARLPEHETAYAMTIHKSQGSEFERVLMILPDRDAPVLTRELIYTGITRAIQEVEVWFTEAVLMKSVLQTVKRNSGLRDALWSAASPAAPGGNQP